jgi:rhamnogalacturonyl hydrolase YesR
MTNNGGHVDANVIGLWPMLAGGAANVARGLALADAQWADVDETGLTKQARFWIDDIYMIASLQAQAWRETGDPRFLDRAALMATRYLDRLQQPNGLFHHGIGSPFFWGRGNGWVAAGLAELLSVLPRDHAHHPAISAGFARMADALLRTQRDDGLWGQLIDRPEFWSESSGSAMFAYAFVRGANQGFLTGPAYVPAALRAWRALAERVEPDGKLRAVCVGTGKGDNLQYYFDRPTVTGDLHGQAPLLWLASELVSRPG